MKPITEITIDDARAVFNNGIMHVKEISLYPYGNGATIVYLISGHRSTKSVQFTDSQKDKLTDLGYAFN